ncbi:MAG: Ditrans,polycis-undecaprenyl-diphosphate synthase ((2E,6E)-farnesyl-diphosphate specific) [Candidatus Accumulibacter phosphatis]|uniref:Isoprenyl transferase n=1 Tax=Candidatus Accumulibacter phosphatis TaxID=327160 RepID=A0A080LWW1_9PROT|nr:polyprenyl diphosphate synthase [Accumulibacter sp.]KFB73193.1 MAG: Ditrans,polycis-undecaprenyl-diphosphate synthase ((2E,6E)-farnesyl-diphosphate specific) [Candidatus Accumulibacter phosphatis]MBL8409069.1 di-trans,poly-cis-decaprenylcistransferase [Accumulibacter sp.]HRF11857.1 polyprenyl diphosphate synthase [Candidatus Accumulibacter phosphatis]
MARFASSTHDVPSTSAVPRHVAIIMDGNGRWAKKRLLPRFAGHHRGVETVRVTVRTCLERGIEYLTLFAFSSENWRRPPEEVSLLMQLFVRVLKEEVKKLDRNGVRLRVIGDLARFDPDLQALIKASEQRTAGNSRLNLTIAANYGGRWDILQAINRMLSSDPGKSTEWQEADLAPHLAMSYAPEPDLFIRTGGEQRISNFLLWQLAYSELYFTEVLWPEFDSIAFDAALVSYQQRERRFGRTSEQLTGVSAASPTGSRIDA